MPATADEVAITVESIPAGSSEDVFRTALQSGKAYQVHRTHLFAVALAITAAAGGSFLVGIVIAMWLVLRVLVPAEDMMDLTPLWVIAPERFTKLVRALVDVGNLEIRFYDSPEHLAWAIKDASKLLSASDLLLQRNEVITLSAPATHTFLDNIRTRMLVRGIKSLAAVGQFKAIIGKDGLVMHNIRLVDSALQLATQAPYTVGDAYGDIQNANELTQAKIISTFIVDTSEGLASYLWIEDDDGMVELYRRANKNAEARFKPLFYKLGSMAFPTVCSVINLESVSDVFTVAKTAATAVISSSDFVESVAKALDLRWRKIYAYCGTLSEFTNGTAEERAFIANQESSKSLPQGQTSAGGTSATAEMWQALPKQPAYADFLSKLSPLDTAPLDNAAICTFLAGSTHPAGLMFLAGTVKFPADSILSRMLTAKADSVLVGAVNKVLAVDKKGTYRAEWGELVSTGTIRKILTGKWLVGSDIDYWKDIGRPYVVALHGEAGAVKIESDGKRSAAGFFSDPRRMDATRETLERIYAFFNLDDDQVGSPKSIYWTLRNRAESIDFLEDSIGTRKLQDDVENLATDTMRMMAEGYILMLSQPLIHAARYACLIQDMKALTVRVTKIDAEIERGQQEQKAAAFGGRASGSMFNASAIGGVDPAPPHPRVSLPRGVSTGWGDSAAMNGVWRTGNGFAYGRQFGKLCVVITSSDTSTPIDTSACAANYYVGSSSRTTPPGPVSLDPWCTKPFVCRGHCNNMFGNLSLEHDQLVDPSWQCIVRPQADPKDAWSTTVRGGGGKGGRGRGGKGDGGKGKGGGRGKGEKGGRVKGGRGIRKQDFQRQR